MAAQEWKDGDGKPADFHRFGDLAVWLFCYFIKLDYQSIELYWWMQQERNQAGKSSDPSSAIPHTIQWRWKRSSAINQPNCHPFIVQWKRKCDENYFSSVFDIWLGEKTKNAQKAEKKNVKCDFIDFCQKSWIILRGEILTFVYFLSFFLSLDSGCEETAWVEKLFFFMIITFVSASFFCVAWWFLLLTRSPNTTQCLDLWWTKVFMLMITNCLLFFRLRFSIITGCSRWLVSDNETLEVESRSQHELRWFTGENVSFAAGSDRVVLRKQTGSGDGRSTKRLLLQPAYNAWRSAALHTTERYSGL